MKRTLQIGLAVLSLASTPAIANARDLTLMGPGGVFETIQNDAYFNPFRQQTGIKLVDAPGDPNIGLLRAQIQGGSPSWDIVEVESQDLALGCEEGLFEVLDYSKIGGKGRYLPGAVSQCGVGTANAAQILGYDKDKLKTAPQGWADFFNTTKFPGRRALAAAPKGTLEIALLGDGVPSDKLYDVFSTKEGVDRAFKKLDSIKKDLVFWKASAQAAQLLASGEVIMTSAWNGRIDAAIHKDHRNFGIVWNGALVNQDSWVILKNSPNLADAYKLLDFMGSADRQAQVSMQIPYGGSNKDANSLLPPERQKEMPTSPENAARSIQFSTDFWIANIDRLTERFNQWASQ